MLNTRTRALVFSCLAGFLSSQAIARPDWAGGPGGSGGSGGGTTPLLSFAADSTEHALGDRVQLSWASEGTRFCQASGDWTGKFDTAGAYWSQPLDGPKSFTLKCMSKSGGVESTVNVAIATTEPAPAPGTDASGSGSTVPAALPVLTFSSADSEVASGGSTTLTWSATDADGCTASNGWSGSFGPTGSQAVGPIDVASTFTLSCSGAGGSTDASLTVAVIEPQPAPEPTPEPVPAPAPTVALSASLAEIAAGGSSTLTWSATDADGCVAGGGWSGSLAASGSQVISGIQTTTSYSLTCSGAGGSAGASTSVTVVPAPTVALASADATVPSGGSTTLTWSAQDASSCQAGGGWSGSLGTSGSQSVGPINASTTYTLSCTGTGGSAVQMVSVSALGQISISWVAPTENVDGTPLTDLSSYRIYYGTESRSYSSRIDIANAAATSHSFSAASGDYFVTMTALDGEGNESAYANEIVRSVP